MRSLLPEYGMQRHIQIESAGIEACHAGEPPDPRTLRIAAGNGVRMEHQRARQVTADDFIRADLLLGMDRGHVAALRRLSRKETAHKIILFSEYACLAGTPDVPDPYYGCEKDFIDVYKMIELGCHQILEILCKPVDMDKKQGALDKY